MRIIGCDLHARQQTIAMLDTDTGELEEKTLEHQGETVREFYSALRGPILVGIEATGSMQWFLELMEELGIECRVGHPAKIRKAETRKQKHDRRDARLLLTLLAENRFPTIWMPSSEQRDLRTLLRHRHQWVRLRSQVQHTLQSMALNQGLRRGRSLWSEAGQDELRALPLAPHASERRAALLSLYPRLQESIDELDKEVREEVQQHPQARRLLTHPGVGPITALATEMFLGDPLRFRDGKVLASYIGMIPSEHSSGRRQRLGAMSKQGNALLRYLWCEAAMHAVGRDPELKRFLSAQTGAEGTGESESRSGPEAGNPTLDHDARQDRLSRVLPSRKSAAGKR
jgi:transposase